MPDTQFIADREIYEKVLLGEVPYAKDFLWLATADIKDLHVDDRGEMVPFLQVLSRLIGDGVSVRLLHAREPGPRFREDFDRFPNLIEELERILCPRVHFKCVIVDGRFAYSGSANLTGAGMGAKSGNRRNFESGFVTTDADVISAVMAQFDEIWMGERCAECDRKEHCASYPEMMPGDE